MEKFTEMKEEKKYAMISYFTIIGVFIAFKFNKTANSSFVSFHIKQMIGLNLILFINLIFIYTILGVTASGMLLLIITYLWFIGFMGVVSDEKRAIPFIGEYFKEWFKDI